MCMYRIRGQHSSSAWADVEFYEDGDSTQRVAEH